MCFICCYKYVILNFYNMKKKEAMKFIREQKGYIPYVALFELYNDDDEIPQELIDLECKKDEPKGYFMIVGQGLYEQLKNLK